MSQPNQKEIEQGLTIALGLSRAVSQEYLAYLQGVKPDVLFSDVQKHAGEVGFQNRAGLLYYMKLAVIDDPTCTYKFDIGKCPGKEVTEAHDRMLLNAQFVTKYLLEKELRKDAVTRPELFDKSRIVFTPHRTAFLYNEVHGKELHDGFTKRIAVVWSREAVRPEDMEATVAPVDAPASSASSTEVKQRVDMQAAAAAAPHPDDWTGPKNAEDMSEADISNLIAQINMGKCRVCGAEETAAGAPTCTCLTSGGS